MCMAIRSCKRCGAEHDCVTGNWVRDAMHELAMRPWHGPGKTPPAEATPLPKASEALAERSRKLPPTDL
jgi:hypothetical protein